MTESQKRQLHILVDEYRIAREAQSATDACKGRLSPNLRRAAIRLANEITLLVSERAVQ